MQQQERIPHLCRTAFRDTASVLCKPPGVDHIKAAEDIVAKLSYWRLKPGPLKGFPENPVAWLYAVAKNKRRTISTVTRSLYGKQTIAGAEKLNLPGHHFYYMLPGRLHTDVDNQKAKQRFREA